MGTVRWPCVVFDLDGTVADSVALIIASYDHALNKVLGQRPDPKLVRTWIGKTLAVTFAEGWPDRADELADTYRQWNRANAHRLITPYEGMAELIVDLRTAGIHAGVATSKGRNAAEETLRIVGVDLPVTVAMEDTDVHKPHPAPLQLAVERLGAPGPSVYIGDAVLDVLAAQAAGMDSIAVTWGAGEPEALTHATPTAIASSVDELRALLLG